MEDFKIRRLDSSPYKIGPSAGSDGKSSGSFNRSFDEQMRQTYKDRVSDLFDEIKAEAEDIFLHMNLPKLEKYRSLISQLLSEVTGKAYLLKSDLVTDSNGKRRVLTLLSVVDGKLDEMAADIIKQDSKLIDYMGRVDEIRGLIMDLFC
jgi:uncharacterized protein YaaR (DUF327 family)